MKYILPIITILFLFVFDSCKDSLGIEDNYKMTLLDSLKQKRYKADSIQLSLQETVTILGKQDTIRIRKFFPFIHKFNCEVNIFSSPPSLWMDLDVENTYNDDSIISYERVKAIQIKVDSLAASGTQLLNGQLDSKNWSDLIIIKYPFGDYLSLEGAASPINLVFTGNSISDQSHGYLTANLIADIPNYNPYLLYTKLTGKLKIFYTIQ